MNGPFLSKPPPGKVLISFLKSLSYFNSNETEEVFSKSVASVRSQDFTSMINGDFLSDPLRNQEMRNLVAVKSDDAEVPIKLWHNKIVRGESTDAEDHALEVLRNTLVISWYRKHTFKSFTSCMKKWYGRNWTFKLINSRKKCQKNSEIFRDGRVGSDALRYVLNTSWWLWKEGSTLLFRRWSKEVKKGCHGWLQITLEATTFPKVYASSAISKKINVKAIDDR